MTRRERNLWLLVGIAALLALFYYIWNNRSAGMAAGGFRPDETEKVDLAEAYRLLRAEPNIRNRQKAVAAIRSRAESHFFASRDPEAAQLSLLRLLEALGRQAGLAVDQKNMTTFQNEYIAVTLEGKTTPASLIRFLQLSGADSSGRVLEIHRLQIHALPEQKLLDYQLVVATLLITKKGSSSGG